ncbi:IS1182 family transposase [Bacillus haimaensis]|uniref:IS1182 family transposase n=1 Tax=Bacillus haimaensis TaxID=3160967 RepID=UPI003AA8F7B8
MLTNQEEFALSPYAKIYDLVVPKDNLLRRINGIVDFSFIHEELKNKYSLDNGRNAIPPIRMFKYLLLKVIFDLSDVDVVERSKYDMSFKFFLDMAPEESVINPSSLTKFRRLRLKDMEILDMLIGKTVDIAIEHNLIKQNIIFIDSTHTNSRYRSKTAKQYLQEKSKLLRKAVYQIDEKAKKIFPEKPVSKDLQAELDYTENLVDVLENNPQYSQIPAVNEKLNHLKEAFEDCNHQTHFSTDSDARVGHKSKDHSFLGYKTHLAISDERIITAAVITSGEKADGKYLKELVEKTNQAGMKVDAVGGDTAYSGKDNLIYTHKKNIKLVAKLHPVITNGTREKEDGFVFNKDANRFTCPAGHLSKTSGLIKKRGTNRNDQLKYFWNVEVCKACPIRRGCYKEGAKSKTYSIPIKSNEHLEQEAFQQTDEFKELARSRYKVEAKNSELKNRHGYEKSKAASLFGMQIQGATTIFAVNLKRIVKLIDEK